MGKNRYQTDESFRPTVTGTRPEDTARGKSHGSLLLAMGHLLKEEWSSSSCPSR